MASLKALEKRIETNIKKAWYENGLALYEIQQDELYKKKYDTFEDYIKERWGFDRSRGYQLINAATLYQVLEDNSVDKNAEFVDTILPKNEGQIRALLSLETKAEQVHVWAKVIETGKKITGELIKSKVTEFKESPEEVQPIKVDITPILEKVQNRIDLRKQEYTDATRKSIESNAPTIHIADCIKYMDKMESDSIDLLITDPPYSTDIDNIELFARNWVLKAIQKLKPTGRAYICIGAYPLELLSYLKILLNEQDKFIVDNPLIWTYKNTLGKVPNMKYNLNYQVILHLYSGESQPLDKTVTNELFSVQEINAPDGRIGNRYHTWQKPDKLAMQFIMHSTKKLDVVFDPFSCTGTFLIAASKLCRVAYGCEIDENNASIAAERGCNIEV